MQPHKSLFTATLAGFMATGGYVAAGEAAALSSLAAHRAVYDVALKDASDRSGISGMDGRIVYEFQGSECDGYTTNFRFVTRIRSASGTRLTDQQTTTYEDGPGDMFRFVTKTFVDDRLETELSGSAVHENGQTVVSLKKPDVKEMTLDPAIFPTAYILDLLKKADAGETVYQTKMFDGSEDGDSVMDTTAIIGQKAVTPEKDADVAKALQGKSYRNVSVSYFSPNAGNTGEETPEYAIAYKLYNNGITRDLQMDYGDFSLTGHLTKLELLPQQGCGE